MRARSFLAGLVLSASACLLCAPIQAQQAATSVGTPVVVPLQNVTGGFYGWTGLASNNGYLGGYVGGIGAFNGNLNSDGFLYRLEGSGGDYKWNTTTLPHTRIETFNGSAMLGYKKAIGAGGWLSTYIGGAFETDNNPDFLSSPILRGSKGGGRALAEYWGPLTKQMDVYGAVSYATPFSTTSANGRLIGKLTDKISIGPELAYFANDAYRDIRAGAFISFKTPFGELAFSGGYRDPLTPGPAGYYANVYLGFER